MIEASEQPPTHVLHAEHGISLEAASIVADARNQLAGAIRQHDRHFVSVDGPCPLTNNPETTEAEAVEKKANAVGLAGYTALDRECFFKPRTKPEDWHGIDTSERAAAYKIISSLAAQHANVTAEVASLDQLKRYNMLTMIWTGGRNVHNHELMEGLALAAPDTVVAVKNGLDGDIKPALEQIDRIEELRGPDQAPAILVYRGGTNAQTPQESQDAYKRAHEATDGKLFYDTAHGIEMAYDPEGNFQKSSAGQVLASQALVHMSQAGYAPLGKFSEASSIPSIMDPHMPLDLALSDSRSIHAHKLG